MLEEQGLVKPKTPKPKQKHRPKSVFREESLGDNFSKSSPPTRKMVTSSVCSFASSQLSFGPIVFYGDRATSSHFFKQKILNE